MHSRSDRLIEQYDVKGQGSWTVHVPKEQGTYLLNPYFHPQLPSLEPWEKSYQWDPEMRCRQHSLMVCGQGSHSNLSYPLPCLINTSPRPHFHSRWALILSQRVPDESGSITVYTHLCQRPSWHLQCVLWTQRLCKSLLTSILQDRGKQERGRTLILVSHGI